MSRHDLLPRAADRRRHGTRTRSSQQQNLSMSNNSTARKDGENRAQTACRPADGRRRAQGDSQDRPNDTQRKSFAANWLGQDFSAAGIVGPVKHLSNRSTNRVVRTAQLAAWQGVAPTCSTSAIVTSRRRGSLSPFLSITPAARRLSSRQRSGPNRAPHGNRCRRGEPWDARPAWGGRTRGTSRKNGRRSCG